MFGKGVGIIMDKPTPCLPWTVCIESVHRSSSVSSRWSSWWTIQYLMPFSPNTGTSWCSWSSIWYWLYQTSLPGEIQPGLELYRTAWGRSPAFPDWGQETVASGGFSGHDVGCLFNNDLSGNFGWISDGLQAYGWNRPTDRANRWDSLFRPSPDQYQGYWAGSLIFYPDKIGSFSLGCISNNRAGCGRFTRHWSPYYRKANLFWHGKCGYFPLSDERFASTSMAGRAAFMVESGDGRGLFQTDFRLQSCRHNLRIFVV